MKLYTRHSLTCALALVLTATSLPAQRNGGNVRSSAQSNVNRSGSANHNANANRNANVNQNANVNRNANVNQNANVNRNVNVNQNVNVNRDVDVNVHGGGYYGGGGCCYNPHPVATAAAVTTAAVATAAIIGSMTPTLPPACTVVAVNGVSHQQCGSTWYQPQFAGGNTTYVVVNAPQ